jgi:hypothetical protein
MYFHSINVQIISTYYYFFIAGSRYPAAGAGCSFLKATNSAALSEIIKVLIDFYRQWVLRARQISGKFIAHARGKPSS